jgi:hypothetical protein
MRKGKADPDRGRIGRLMVLWLGCSILAALGVACSPPPVADDPDPEPQAEVTPAPTPVSTPEPEPTPSPEPTPTPVPSPTPYPFIPRQNVDVTRFYNGITIQSELVVEEPRGTAAVDRLSLDSYTLEMTMRIRLPQAARTLAELKKNDPTLPAVWPSLGGLLESARVSPAFDTLYQNKVDYIRPRLSRLEEILSRHNFYDCDTILELTHPETGRRALLLSADMDVNVDGSDGDRNVEIEPRSPFFQPQTSFRWPKQTDRPNQFLQATEDRLAEVRAQLADPATTAEEKTRLRRSETTLVDRLAELRRWSFLISDTDPSIVLPGFMFRMEDGPFRPVMGDYALVIYGGVVYPAIVGDAGPSFKMGEASMRICREIEPRTSAARRAVSNIRVQYVVFPGTHTLEGRVPPDLEIWNQRAREFWVELGGDPAAVKEWENIVPPWPDEVEETDESAASEDSAEDGGNPAPASTEG